MTTPLGPILVATDCSGHAPDRAMCDQAQRQLQALAHEADLLPAQWELWVVEGDVSRRIVEQEPSRACDLVVLAEGHADMWLSTMNGRRVPSPPLQRLPHLRWPGKPAPVSPSCPWEPR